MKSNRLLWSLLILLSVGLLISVTLNVVIFSRAQQYYFQLNGIRLDPFGIKSFYPPQANQQIASDARKKVLFFGDSRAYEWPAPADLSQFQFVNRGIGSQTSVQVAARFDEHVKPLRPQIIVVQVGINDLKTIPLFPNQKESIIANCKANIKQIVSQSRTLGATVILSTIIPFGQIPLERRPFWSDEVAEAIEEVNAFIYSLSEEKVILFDTVPVLTDEKGIVRKEYSRDFLHLNETAYRALNRELVEILAQIDQ